MTKVKENASKERENNDKGHIYFCSDALEVVSNTGDASLAFLNCLS